eukprot:scaffold60459_cov31-Tisochrysis_lutea.AAC.8
MVTECLLQQVAHSSESGAECALAGIRRAGLTLAEEIRGISDGGSSRASSTIQDGHHSARPPPENRVHGAISYQVRCAGWWLFISTGESQSFITVGEARTWWSAMASMFKSPAISQGTPEWRVTSEMYLDGEGKAKPQFELVCSQGGRCWRERLVVVSRRHK